MARDRPSPYGKWSRSGYRSAGACPPRTFQAPSRGAPRKPCASERVSPRDRCMARDRPSPYGKGGRAEDIARPFAIRRSQTTEPRSAEALGCHMRIRAGFPRDRSRAPETVVRDRLIPNGSNARPPHLPSRGGLSSAIVAWRGTGPRPTVKGGVLRTSRGRLRSGDRKLQSPVARGPSPRHRDQEGSPTGETELFGSLTKPF